MYKLYEYTPTLDTNVDDVSSVRNHVENMFTRMRLFMRWLAWADVVLFAGDCDCGDERDSLRCSLVRCVLACHHHHHHRRRHRRCCARTTNVYSNIAGHVLLVACCVLQSSAGQQLLQTQSVLYTVNNIALLGVVDERTSVQTDLHHHQLLAWVDPNRMCATCRTAAHCAASSVN